MELLIARAEAHRLTLGLSHKKFATRFAEYVGSHKTWEFRLFARKWSELKHETWLPRLRKLALKIEGSTGDQEIFADLPIVKHAVYLYDTLQSRTNDRRCAILIGTQGTGKTLSLRHLERENNYAPAFLSANETWKDSRARIANALGAAVKSTITPSASQTFQNAIEHLKANPMNILIDEAHEGGVLLMKLVKSLINETQCKIMLGIYPTAWRRLTNGANDAYEEAQQLLRRTIRPIKNDWIAGITEKDVEAWAKCVELEMPKTKVQEIMPLVRKHGNYSLLTDALERARFLASEDDEEVTAKGLCEQVGELCREPKQETKLVEAN